MSSSSLPPIQSLQLRKSYALLKKVDRIAISESGDEVTFLDDNVVLPGNQDTRKNLVFIFPLQFKGDPPSFFAWPRYCAYLGS